ncbi:MAG: GNAT family N-acetyltransferase [Hyphomicrobiales bacterium]
MTSPLDNPVWHALTGPQAQFALGAGPVRRYLPDISPFAGVVDCGAGALDALAGLVPVGGQALVLMAASDPIASTRLLVARSFEGVQMVARSVTAPDRPLQVVDLGDADVADMLELASLTRPGPFLPRTHVLGQFIGIREQGRLVAMAGERFRLAGFTEVSGVCTHPDRRGRGHAGLLSRVVAARIAARGETPMLHAFATNDAAIRLYGALGFVIRTRLQGAVLTRQA